MEEDNSPNIWVVVPINWVYDDQCYDYLGYELPVVSFTLEEMAKEWAIQKSMNTFREIALGKNFSGYVTESTIRFSICWSEYSQRWSDAMGKEEWPISCSSQEYDSYFEEVYKNFCKKWNIEEENFKIEKADLEKMSDEKACELMREINLQFYIVKPVRILC